MNIAIILAAGKSQRTGKINKVFYQILGRPLIYYTVKAFENHPKIQKIILVVRKNEFRRASSFTRKYKLKKIAAVIIGGKERQYSAYNGLKAAGSLGAKTGDLILFHNGANPLVSEREITEVIKEAKKYKAALVAQPLKDTLKKSDKWNFIKETIPRENLWLAQTPQVIEYTLALKAFEKAKKDKLYGTDDISLIERLGEKVKIIPASSQNIKVTKREDLETIKILLKNK